MFIIKVKLIIKQIPEMEEQTMKVKQRRVDLKDIQKTYTKILKTNSSKDSNKPKTDCENFKTLIKERKIRII